MYLFIRKTKRLSITVNDCSAVNENCMSMCKAQSAFLRDLHQIVSSWSAPASNTLGYAWTPLAAPPHIPVHSALSNIYSWITARCTAPGWGLYFGDALSAHSRPCFLWKSSSFHWPLFVLAEGMRYMCCVFLCVRLQLCACIVDPLRCILYSGDAQQLLSVWQHDCDER